MGNSITEMNKKKALAGMKSGNGTVLDASKLSGVSRSSIYNYLRDDADFLADWKDAKEYLLNKALGVLSSAMDDGNLTAAIFVAKTTGRNLGLNEHHDPEQLGKDSDKLTKKLTLEDKKKALAYIESLIDKRKAEAVEDARFTEQ